MRIRTWFSLREVASSGAEDVDALPTMQGMPMPNSYNADDELVQLDPVALDAMDVGTEFTGIDYYLLAVLGLLVPVALLIWGWL